MKTKIIGLIVVGIIMIIMGSYGAIRYLQFEGKEPYVTFYQVQQTSSGTSEVQIYKQKFTHDLNVVFLVEVVSLGNNRYEYYFEELIDFDLDSDHTHAEDELHDPNASFNLVSIKNGKISVIHANCPNKICMRSSININSYVFFNNQIICAPHKLRITIEAGE
ncbi:MAG TPA: NusG domain II-containing protein [Bacilli bacterium]|nr:NusG domain II-containing protein [Bacilli bacterium]